MTDLDAWLDPDGVIDHAAVGSKRAVLGAVAEAASRRFGLPAADILERLAAREAQSSTGLGHGVALPHAALPGLHRMRAIFVRLGRPAPFDAVDDEPVNLVFALFAPEAAANAPAPASAEPLRALAKAARLLRGQELREALRQARSADSLYALLTRQAAAAT